MYCTSGYDQVTSSLNQPRFAVSITWFAVSILRFAVSTPYSLKSRLIMSGLSWVIRGFIVSSVLFSYCSIGMHVENAVKSVFSSPRARLRWSACERGRVRGWLLAWESCLVLSAHHSSTYSAVYNTLEKKFAHHSRLRKPPACTALFMHYQPHKKIFKINGIYSDFPTQLVSFCLI